MTELSETAERVMEVARSAGATDAVSEAMEMAVRQVRFSNSQIDAVNSWSEKHLALFVAVGKKVMSSDIRTLDDVDSQARELVALVSKVPPSKTYGGIASGRFRYRRGAVDAKIASLKDPSRYVHDAIWARSPSAPIASEEHSMSFMRGLE